MLYLLLTRDSLSPICQVNDETRLEPHRGMTMTARFWTSTAAEREARKVLCGCFDKGCKANHGHACLAMIDPRAGDGSGETLFRIDMDDKSGTLFCRACADDALESGVFCSFDDTIDPRDR